MTLCKGFFLMVAIESVGSFEFSDFCDICVSWVMYCRSLIYGYQSVQLPLTLYIQHTDCRPYHVVFSTRKLINECIVENKLNVGVILNDK